MPYRPTHRQLEYLVAVADHGHFGQAARACHVSQPTLSAQLKLLEDRLGVVLIDRSGATVQPTPAGRAILPLARSALETLDELVAVAGADAEMLGGLVRLGVAPTIGPYLLPGVLSRLHHSYPRLEIYIREERPAVLEPTLAEGMLDCILTPLPLDTERFEVMLLCDERIYLGVPARHRLAGPGTVSVEDLAGERMLTLGRGHRLFDHVQVLCSASGARMSEDYEGTSLDALRQMVSIGMGLSLFPAAYVAMEFPKDGEVIPRDLAGWPMRRSIALAWRRNSPRRSHFATLAHVARQAVADMHADGLAVAGLDADGPGA
ncbi:LysR substrate-binding domain-containing protein [Polymorphum gilvum]|uniref:LysR family transcriptional regulator n=1 Tax=Polymorphum gilvum (strain LMG 25793 / CGMCC 1.9160 / SL003B-26A1) TaxID=991905 RepID=F2J0E9_POLGS|nr:LysR substrate-binding domain-containing protein [Polymorphum gilvum]ADZ69617.1 LysR family transcriptional regulator [Polymorphum gilvum SL003B-26A1]